MKKVIALMLIAGICVHLCSCGKKEIKSNSNEVNSQSGADAQAMPVKGRSLLEKYLYN